MAQNNVEHAENGGSASLSSALGALGAFLPLAKSPDRASQRAFADERGLMLDALVDKINTVAGDILGDILIEEVDGHLAIIEDYRDVLIEEGVLEDGK